MTPEVYKNSGKYGYVLVVYDTKYDNTKPAAETIIEGIKEVSGIDTTLSNIKEVDLKKISEYDAILIGSPNHMGGCSSSR